MAGKNISKGYVMENVNNGEKTGLIDNVGLTEKIGLGEKIAYGAGDFASGLVGTFTGYLAYFYTNNIGISITVVGTILMASRIFDGITDLLMGFVMDRTRSKHGKARPWLLWLAFPTGAALLLTVTMPASLGITGKIIYAFITYNLVTTVCYTAINIPYGALNSLMTRDQYQRSVINIFRMIFAAVCGLIVNAVTMPIINALGATQSSWITLVASYAAAATVLFLLCFRFTKERVAEGNTIEVSTISFKDSIRAMLKNKYWLIISGTWVLFSIAMTFLTSSMIYYAEFILGSNNYVSLISIVVYGPCLLTMGLLAPIIKKFGKRNAAMCGIFLIFVSSVPILFAPANVAVVLVSRAFSGFGIGAVMGTIFAMVADTIEYGHWKTGRRVQGILYSSLTFGARVAAGLGTGVASWLLVSAGYDGMSKVQPPEVFTMLKIEFIIIPMALCALAVIGYYFYKLDREYPAIIKALTEGKNEKTL